MTASAIPPLTTLVEQWLAALDLDQKIDLLSGQGMETKAFPALGIPSLKMADGPVGVRSHEHPSTAFPVSIALAASWNVELIGEVARAIASEYRALGKRAVLGPTLDLQRHPRYGRAFETFGEDPFLTSRLGVSYLRAIHAEGLVAVAKHFALNTQEAGKHEFDEVVDERTLHELYFPPFLAAIREAGLAAIMGAYNSVNGAFCCENAWLLEDVLRRQWGFEGVVISDWGAVYDGEKAFLAGCDLEMPDGREYTRARLRGLLERDPSAREKLDAAARRVLEFVARWEDPQSPLPFAPERLQSPHAIALARRAAREGVVLLKNEGSALPLEVASIRRIAVLGPNANRARTGGGGSSCVEPGPVSSPLDALRAFVPEDCEIVFAEGAFLDTDAEPIPAALLRAADEPDAAEGLRGEYFANDRFEGEPVLTRVDPSLQFAWHIDGPTPEVGANYSVRWTSRFTPDEDGLYAFGLVAGAQKRCGARAWLDDTLLFDTWNTADPDPLYQKEVQLTAGTTYRLRVEYFNELGFSHIHLTARRIPKGLLEDAIEAAARADVAIVFAGFSKDHESEGRDRRTLALPPEQVALIEAVTAVNPRTVVVLNSGAAVLPGRWLDQVPAVLTAWFPGQAGAEALVELLFGQFNPSGKLPCTFLREESDCRALRHFPAVDGVVRLEEGWRVGYRDFDDAGREVAFPFGHGLSYTLFEYSDLECAVVGEGDARALRCQLTLTNLGTREGTETVQLYVGALAPSLPRPVRELKAFARCTLAPGESRRISLEVSVNDLRLYDPALPGWRADPGRYRLEIGASSRDPRLLGEFQI